MKHLSIIALSLAVLASFSCAKDYLDTAPTGDTSPATIFETTGKAAVAVNGLGKIMHRQYGAYGQGYNGEGTVRLYYGDYLGNNLMKGNSTTFKDDAIGARFVNNTANLDGFAWYYYYTLIGNANTILKNIDAAEGTDGDRAYIKAQTLTYRAYAYFNLAQ
ncbi:MAG: RagB/SusD family nutrient uptake outer membrane protein, partial [Bacteroidales bacterium]|nr:RagB/SusD family nutrient uptake outer membrane protein [Bacteroidales bacterium]